jgi:hypothetical protein
MSYVAHAVGARRRAPGKKAEQRWVAGLSLRSPWQSVAILIRGLIASDAVVWHTLPAAPTQMRRYQSSKFTIRWNSWQQRRPAPKFSIKLNGQFGWAAEP